MKLYDRLLLKCFQEKEILHLDILRMGTSLVVFSMMLSLYPDLINIYGSKSFFNHEILFSFKPAYYPRLEWLTGFIQNKLFINEIYAIKICYFVFLLTLFLLFIGRFIIVTSLSSLIFYSLFMGSGDPFIYGCDFFVQAGLFYCFIFYLLSKLLSNRNKPKSFLIFSLTLQIHLCVVYSFNGIAKSFGDTWWSGEAIWRALMLLDTRTYDLGNLAKYFGLVKYTSWIVLISELFFPILILWSKTRVPTIFILILMHIFIGIFMHLYFFSAIMLVLIISAFWSDLSRFSIPWNTLFPKKTFNYFLKSKKNIALIPLCIILLGNTSPRPRPVIFFKGFNCNHNGFGCGILGVQPKNTTDEYFGVLNILDEKKLVCTILKSTIGKTDLEVLMKKGFILKNAIELNSEVCKELRLRRPRLISPKLYFAKSENEQIIFEFDLVEADDNSLEGNNKPRIIKVPIKD